MKITKNLLAQVMLLSAVNLLSLPVFAETDSDGDGVVDSIDVDDDNDGLIELYTLHDLSLMSFDYTGSSLKSSAEDPGSTEGCSYTGEDGLSEPACTGYELMADVDFDTNANGMIDMGDEFCNYSETRAVCEGWIPVYLYADFTGNGHRISNLYIDRPDDFYIGFFSKFSSHKLSNVEFSGALTSVTGGYYVGIAVGSSINDSRLSGIRTEGTVTAYSKSGGIAGGISSGKLSASSSKAHVISTNPTSTSGSGGIVGSVWGDGIVETSFSEGKVHAVYAGGITGNLDGYAILRNSFSVADVMGEYFAGGLTGNMRAGSTIENSLALGVVAGGDYYRAGLGGLIGFVDTDTQYLPLLKIAVTHSHWATDTTQQSKPYGNELEPRDQIEFYRASSSEPATLSELECPEQASEGGCASDIRLYIGWDESLWDFGTSNQLPGLNLAGTVYRPVQTMDGSFDVVTE